MRLLYPLVCTTRVFTLTPYFTTVPGPPPVGASVMVPVRRAGVGITCEYDRVEAGLPPELHEMDHVPEAERRVPCEDHARLPEVVAEVAVDAGVVLQLVGLDELRQTEESPRGHVSLSRWKEAHTIGGEPEVN